jgi:hypothetical protein
MDVLLQLALAERDRASIAKHLRALAKKSQEEAVTEALLEFAELLDPKSNSEWHLEFRTNKRGNPNHSKPPVRDSRIALQYRDLLAAKLAAGKAKHGLEQYVVKTLADRWTLSESKIRSIRKHIKLAE